MRKWVKWLIAGGVILCLLGAFLFGYLRVNRLYPSAEKMRHRIGDTFTANDLEITGTGSQLLTVPQLKDLYPQTTVSLLKEDGSPLSDENIRILLVTVKVKSLSGNTDISYLYSAGAQSGAWHNGMSFGLYTQLNTEQTPDADGCYNLVLPYEIFSLQFNEKDWESVGSLDYQVVFSLYPTLHILDLDL